MTQALDEIKIGGLGASRKRVEDNRFIRGKGNYTDDIVLPGMLHMEILRSPLAHARIKSIDTSKAWQIPGVHLVLTGEMMATRNLAWMPTLSYDTQAVLATDKVRFQGQEVACVIADDPYIAKDACEAIDVEYEPLPAIVNPAQAAGRGRAGHPRRQGEPGQQRHLRLGGRRRGRHRPGVRAGGRDLQAAAALPALAPVADRVLRVDRGLQPGHLEAHRVHDDPGAAHHPGRGRAGGRAARAHDPDRLARTSAAASATRCRSTPGYVCSILASILLERPVKWIEDKSGNLISTGFARDIYLDGEMALRKDGKILGVRMHCDADHGAFFSDAQPSKFKIGLLHSAFACYDIPAAHLTARGTYTNKAPGGVAYRCSFRVTEAMFFQERMIQAAADDLGMDQAEFRRMNFVRDDDFPHRTPFGFLTDSGQYAQVPGRRAEGGRLRGLPPAAGGGARPGAGCSASGISTMTEPLGAGNSREYDILGIKMFDSADLKVHMTGKAILRTGAKTQGQGHETTWAQIVAHELGIPAEDVVVEEGDTDTAPFGMGTYASRSTPVAGAAVAMVSRKIRAKARKLAAHLLEVSEEDVEWELGRFYVRSAPDRGVTIQECAMAAYSNMPDGMEPGLENTAYYDPPNLTWPFACYIVTVEVDPETGVWDVLNMVAVDDCGVRINPMIVEGQIMGGLTEAYAMANMQFITFDAEGNCVGSNYMDYLLPTAWETPGFELHSEVVTPCPHHPIGAKGIGECAAVGGPAAFVNAVMDAIVRHRGPQHRHAAAARPGLGGHHLAPRRLRRAAGELGRLTGSQRMDGWGVLEQAGELARRGQAFALATVVWRQGPSSGQQGSRAIITAAGELHGWIGGACAEPAVIREARRVIAEGEPRLLLLGTPEQFGAAVPEGMTVVPISCQSEGALEVYIEPVLPAPHLVVVGRSPMAQTLADLARALGWRTELIDGPDFSAADADERSMVVVATQGHGDEEAVEQAVAARPAYLGLVGSPRRGAAVLGYLADRGVPKDQLDRVTVPAGLDLGRPRTGRSPSPSWPSSSSCAPPATLAARPVPTAPARARPALPDPGRSLRAAAPEPARRRRGHRPRPSTRSAG